VKVGLGVTVSVWVGTRLGVGETRAAVTGAVALMIKSWPAGKVTATLAGMTMGLLQALRKTRKNKEKIAARIFMGGSSFQQTLYLYFTLDRARMNGLGATG
jgi:hypothetical protein